MVGWASSIGDEDKVQPQDACEGTGAARKRRALQGTGAERRVRRDGRAGEVRGGVCAEARPLLAQAWAGSRGEEAARFALNQTAAAR